MSAFGALRQTVEELISQVTDALHAKDNAQDKRLNDLEKRVTALESPAAPATARKTTAAKSTPSK